MATVHQADKPAIPWSLPPEAALFGLAFFFGASTPGPGFHSRDGLSNGRLLLRAWISPFNSRELPGDGPHGAAYKTMWGDTASGVARGGLEPAMKAGLKTKPKELVEAYRSGRAQYYGMYKRSYEGEDVHFDNKVAKVESDSSPSASGSASPTSDK